MIAYSVKLFICKLFLKDFEYMYIIWSSPVLALCRSSNYISKTFFILPSFFLTNERLTRHLVW